MTPGEQYRVRTPGGAVLDVLVVKVRETTVVCEVLAVYRIGDEPVIVGMLVEIGIPEKAHAKGTL